MSECRPTVSFMKTDSTSIATPLNRASFSAATPSRRRVLTAEWLTAADIDPAEAEFVRRVRERDLADARALFAPNLTMVAILTTLLALSITWGMLLGAIVAPIGILIVARRQLARFETHHNDEPSACAAGCARGLGVLTRIVVHVGETSVVELELSRFPRVHGGLSCPR